MLTCLFIFVVKNITSVTLMPASFPGSKRKGPVSAVNFTDLSISGRMLIMVSKLDGWLNDVTVH